MTISTPQWNESDAERYAQLGNQAHVPVLSRAIADLVDLTDRQVLDFGCGEGRLTLALAAETQPRRVVGLDISEQLIATARRLTGDRSAVRFEVADESALPLDPPVDAAVCSLMLMMCRTRRQLAATVRGLVESVRPGGPVVIALTHPCFRAADYGTFRNDLPTDFSYWQSGRDYDVQLAADDEHDSASIRDTHWTLSDYVNAVLDAGGAVDRVHELPVDFDGAGRPAGPPAFLLLRVVRVVGRADRSA